MDEDGTLAPGIDASLFDAATLVDPYPAYKTLRDTAPVHFEPNFGAWIVTRYDLVREALRDTETYSSEFGDFLSQAQKIAFRSAPPDVQQELIALNKRMIPLPPTMLTLDEPRHTQYRSLVSQLFTGSQVKRSEPTVRRVIDAGLERLSAALDTNGEAQADFVAEFALPVPLRIIADRLGIPGEHRAFFNEAAAAAADALRLTPLSPQEMVHRAQLAVELQQLLVSLVDARRETPVEDMIGILANAMLEEEQRPLTHGEILSILNQFLVAGHETTTSAFAWGMLILCRNPDLPAEIRGDTARIRTFVEETSAPRGPGAGPAPIGDPPDGTRRHGPLEPGSLVMLRFGSANRDEREFEDPDSVDIHRAKAGRQLAFGSGIHHCIGAPLARQELNLGWAALLDAFEGFRLNDGAEPEAEPSFILRNLPQLPVRYRPRVEAPG